MKNIIFMVLLVPSFFFNYNSFLNKVERSTKEGKNQYHEKANREVSKSKKALIISNGVYKKKTKWPNINSHNDIALIKKALIYQGYTESNIKVEKDLTYKKINETFKDFISKLKKNDIVYVHFSGHGQQIYDDKETNDEIDGYDEAIIPVDAPINYQKNGYKGEMHLRDEKLGEYLDSIRQKISSKGSLFVVIDACHSGTATRGLNSVRGHSKPFEPEGYEGKSTSSINGYNIFNSDSSLAPAIYFFGSRANQLNYEYESEKGKYVGSLSYALSKALSETTKNSTYQGLFDKVKRIMYTIAPNQSPQAEGSLNQKILGGEITGKKEYYTVIQYKNRDNVSFLRLNGGTLNGIHVGSKVAVFDVDGLDSKEPKSTGVVIKTDVIQSQVKLDRMIKKDDAENSWVVITERNYGNLNVSVCLDSLDQNHKNLKKELSLKIDKSRLISIDTSNPDLLVESVQGRQNSIQIYTKNDMIYWTGQNPDANEVIKRIELYSRVSFMRSLEMENKELNATFTFIPRESNINGMDDVAGDVIPIENKTNASGTIIFNEGDFVDIKVKNNSNKTLYYTVLDFQPDNKVNVLIPNGRYSASDYVLERGQEYTHSVRFSAPYGTEVFKLISSEEPLDLRSILINNGTRGPRDNWDNPFELLFEDSFDTVSGTRGAESRNIPSGAINIFTKTFEIQKKVIN